MDLAELAEKHKGEALHMPLPHSCFIVFRFCPYITADASPHPAFSLVKREHLQLRDRQLIDVKCRDMTRIVRHCKIDFDIKIEFLIVEQPV